MTTGTSAKRKLVVIEDGVIAGLAASPTALAAFPFLRALTQTVKKPTSGCKCKPNPVQASLYASAKAAIAGMSADSKRKLKALLNAEQVRVIYRKPGAAGKPQEIVLTF